jgi:protein TonB
VAPKTEAHDSAAVPSVGAAPYRLTLDAKPLVALTRDRHLLATLKKVTDPAHEVRAVGSEIDLSSALMSHHGGVAVLDCAAVANPIATLTERVHAQFPDLVLIVAGGSSEQGALAAQITDGSVHRFLHKPVSEQRVRLFVESAWRRHAEDDGVLRAVRAAPPVRPAGAPKWWLAFALFAVVAAALGWYLTRTPQASHEGAAAVPAGAASPATPGDAALEELLARASQALAAGALVAPPEANAADLYRLALQRSARDPRALSGLEQVIEGLLAGAEAELQQQHLQAAQQLADQARAISPDHPRVAFLTAQIAAQRDRAVLGKAQRAAADGNVASALATLDDAARGSERSTLMNEARTVLAQQQLDAKVAEKLEHARDALGRGALLEPTEDNARSWIEAARALAPNDPAVQQAAQDLVARLEHQARDALSAHDADAVDRWAAGAAEAGADPAHVAGLHRDAQRLRSAAHADSLAQLTQAFNQSLEQGHVMEPAAESAGFYLAQLTQADADAPATQTARAAYRTRLLAETRSALNGSDLAGAHHWLAEARAAGADASELGTLEASLTHAQEEAQQASTYVNESTLTRTRYQAPQFPQVALQRGIDGWVDLQFLVGADGTVGDLKVVGTQPAGMFEQSALEAVRHWRYEPVVRNGHPVSQRASVRVRFTVQR